MTLKLICCSPQISMVSLVIRITCNWKRKSQSINLHQEIFIKQKEEDQKNNLEKHILLKPKVQKKKNQMIVQKLLC